MKKILIPVLGLLSASPIVANNPAITLTDNTPISVEEMKSLKEKVIHRIQVYREQKYTCSQATFLGICETLKSTFTQEELKALSAGFAGGIGRTFNEGTCGALTAGIMALGMYLPQENEKAVALSQELFEHFKQQEGTVICGNITQKHGFSRCTGCCLCIGEKVTELLQRENVLLLEAPSINWNNAKSIITNS